MDDFLCAPFATDFLPEPRGWMPDEPDERETAVPKVARKSTSPVPARRETSVAAPYPVSELPKPTEPISTSMKPKIKFKSLSKTRSERKNNKNSSRRRGKRKASWKRKPKNRGKRKPKKENEHCHV